MDNDININVKELRNVPNFNISDVEIIRQIGLYTIANPFDRSLDFKIKKGFEYAALYPHVMKPFNVKPDEI